MIDPKHYGLVEMGFTAFAVLGFAFWQLWSLREKPKPRDKDRD